jgi:uncharacterized protein YeaO (DUF488 family)
MSKQVSTIATHAVTSISVKRAYDDPESGDGYRVLIDRMWPRGRSRGSLKLDEQVPELAPSAAVRRSFAHDPEHWIEFQVCYKQELRAESMQNRMKELLASSHGRHITLVYGAKDEVHNHAVVLRDELSRLSANNTLS